MNRAEFISQLERIKEKILLMGGTIRSSEMDSPAIHSKVDLLEQVYGVSLPIAFKATLLNIASNLSFTWSFEDATYEAIARKLCVSINNTISSGSLEWSVDRLLSDSSVKYYKKFNNDATKAHSEDFAGLVNTIAISEVPNGDEIRLNLITGAVFYFSHDGDELNLLILAPNFDEYVSRLLKIAVVGPEIWQQVLFIDKNDGGIDLSNPKTIAWIDIWNSASV